VRFEEEEVEDPSLDNRVIEQSVDPGQALEDGDRLVITLGDAGDSSGN
jgi:beta-lactam-binding protein with PASTA domain